MDEVRKLIQSLKGKNVIGGDVACLMPTKDSQIKLQPWLHLQLCLK